MYRIYIQYTSPTRGKQRPILFDKTPRPVDAISLLQKAKSTVLENTTAFIGKPCKWCEVVWSIEELVGRSCPDCYKKLPREKRMWS